MSETGTLPQRLSRALAWSVVNNLVVRFGGLLVGVLLARLLAPRAFGVYAVGLAVQTILVTLSELGMSAGLVKDGDIERRGPTVTTVALAASSLLAAATYAMAGHMAAIFGSPDSSSTIRVLTITLVLSGFGAVPYARLQRDFLQSRQFAADLASLVTSTAVVLALLALGLGPLALAWSRVAGQAAATGVQFRVTRCWPRLGFEATIAREAVRFGGPLALANLLSWVLLNIDYLVVGHVAGPTLLGLYVLAFNLSSWPMTAIGQALRSVALPGFARLREHRSEAMEALLLTSSVAWALALILGLVLSLLAEPVVVLLYGSRWAPAAGALSGLAFFGAFRVLFDVMASFQIATGRNRAVLWIQFLWLLALGPAMYVGVHLDGLIGASVAHVGVALLVVLPGYVLSLPHPHDVSRRLLRHLAAPTLAALPAALTIAVIRMSTPNAVLQVLLGSSAAALVYLVFIHGWAVRLCVQLNLTLRGTSV